MAHCVSVSAAGMIAWALCSAGLGACKKKAPTPPAPQPELHEDSPESSESVAPTPPSPGPVVKRCQELPQAAPFRIGELAHASSRADEPDDGGPDDDDEVPDPYAVELGSARADKDGFTLSALRTVKGQTHALIALVGADADAASGKVIDLGVVHGDPDPPLFVVRDKDVWLVTPDTDAGGGTLRTGVIHDARGSAKVSWGPELAGVRRDSTFALESSGERALLAYAAEAQGKIRVFGVLLAAGDPKQKLTPEPLGAAGADVDSPRLALRPGGYWLAVARSLDSAKPAAKAQLSDASTGEEAALLDIGARRIEVTKLDAQGKPISSALVVTAPGTRPMSFELGSAADGSAYVGFRGDDSTPGAAAGALQLVHVKLDGSLEKLELSGESNGAGTPSFLRDDSPEGELWLTAAGENGATIFGRVREQSALLGDSVVRGGDLIAAHEGKLLLARSKGTAAELSLLRCAE
jgi:hypothetical protein